MLTYTISHRQLAEADVYDVQPVRSLAEFLEEHSSLCIVKAPYEGTLCEMTRVTGKKRNGDPAYIYLGVSPGPNQGFLKSKLDRSLHSAYLFISWKQKGFHSFKLLKERRILAEFPDFPSALDAYFPDGFLPEKRFLRIHTVFELMCLSLCRRKKLQELIGILNRIRFCRMKIPGSDLEFPSDDQPQKSPCINSAQH